MKQEKVLRHDDQRDAAGKVESRPSEGKGEPEQTIKGQIQREKIEELEGKHKAKSGEARHWIEHDALKETQLVKQTFVGTNHDVWLIRLTRRK